MQVKEIPLGQALSQSGSSSFDQSEPPAMEQDGLTSSRSNKCQSRLPSRLHQPYSFPNFSGGFQSSQPRSPWAKATGASNRLSNSNSREAEAEVCTADQAGSSSPTNQSSPRFEEPAEAVEHQFEQPMLEASTQNDDKNRDSSTNNDECSASAEKKMKLDSNSSTTDQSSGFKPASAPRVIKKEIVSEVEKEAAKKRETISFEERVETFKQLLDEKEVNFTSTFQRELSKIVFDPRYLLLTSNERREVFEKYCLEKVEEERKRRHAKIKKASGDFKELLAEANLSSRSVYDDFHTRYSKDPRYKALERTKDREILFDDHLALLRRKEREERSNTRQVQRLSASRTVPREEAESIYQSLLLEFVTDSELSWHVAKRILRKSPQWELTEDLSRSWKEAIFEKHLDKIYQRRKEKFHQLLDETKEVTLSSDWRDVKKMIRDDPRYIKLSSSDRRCEREFRDFIKKKRSAAEDEFRQLLRETTIIDKDTRRRIEESEHQHLIDVIGTLQNDRRYVELEPFSEERRKILLSYIEELAATSSEFLAAAESTTSEEKNQ